MSCRFAYAPLLYTNLPVCRALRGDITHKPHLPHPSPFFFPLKITSSISRVVSIAVFRNRVSSFKEATPPTPLPFWCVHVRTHVYRRGQVGARVCAQAGRYAGVCAGTYAQAGDL